MLVSSTRPSGTMPTSAATVAVTGSRQLPVSSMRNCDHTSSGVLIGAAAGAPVTAVGGNFWGTDINFNTIPADMSVELSDGTVHNYSTSSPTGFAGFVSDMTITSVIVGVSAGGGNVWATLDNLYVGGAIPTPGALGLFGVAGLAAARRRR